MADGDENKPEGDKLTPDADGMVTDAGKRALQAERDRVRDLERQISELKPLADAAKKAEDDQKSEVQRLTDQVQELTRQRDTATVERDRFQVALEKGLTVTQAKRLVGGTAEELASDADTLLEDLGVTRGDGQGEDRGLERKPKPDLKPGSGDPDAPVEETDIKALGERMFSN